MSLASRTPAHSFPASHPVVVDRQTGVVDWSAVRADVRSRTRATGIWRWEASRALADTFRKVRLQRAWALKAIAENAALARDAAAKREAFEAAALAKAERHDFDVTALTHQVTRWSCSLGARWDALENVKLYRRARDIAVERAGAGEFLAAAE